MMVNEAARVEEMLIRKLREENLSNVLRMDKTQFLDMDDYVFGEVVISDGAELDRVEGIVAGLVETLIARGTRVDSIVRAVWEVTDIRDHGTAYGQDGAPRAAHEFYVGLKSGTRSETIVVEIGWGTMESFKRKSDREIAEIIRTFVNCELKRGGTSYWDPLKDSRVELSEAAIAFIAARAE